MCCIKLLMLVKRDKSQPNCGGRRGGDELNEAERAGGGGSTAGARSCRVILYSVQSGRAFRLVLRCDGGTGKDWHGRDLELAPFAVSKPSSKSLLCFLPQLASDSYHFGTAAPALLQGMAKHKPAAAASATPSEPSSARFSRGVAISDIVALALVAKLSQLQADLLRPLFSSSESVVTSALLPLLVVPFASVLRLCIPRIVRIEWSICWMVLGLSFLVSDEVLRIGAVSLMQLGADRGMWSAALLLRGPALVSAAAWIASGREVNGVSHLTVRFELTN